MIKTLKHRFSFQNHIFDGSYLKAELSQERYTQIRLGVILIVAGTIIAIIENYIAILLRLHHVNIFKAATFGTTVIISNIIFLALIYSRKRFLVWHEWMMFMLYFMLYIVFFFIWGYRLGELRILAIINAITSLTILLSYVNMVQSLLISVGIFVSYYSLSWYALEVAGQPGNLEREAFLSFCMLPAFIVITVVAWHMNKNRSNSINLKNRLQDINNELRGINNDLNDDRKSIEMEMTIAGEIQQIIFPQTPPDIKGWDIAILTKSIDNVSGDFHDVYTDGCSLKGISLFDVSGHGVAPALLTIYAKPVLYKSFKKNENSRFCNVIETMSSNLYTQLSGVDLYITGLILRFNGNNVEYINAGHPDIIHYHDIDKRIEILEDLDGSFKSEPIGVMSPDKICSSFKFEVERGDILVMYSDGIIENRNSSNEEFGINRLSDIIKSHNDQGAVAIINSVKNRYSEFIGETPADDDITIIIAIKQ